MVNEQITILLATYNGERFLPELIESIRGQSYVDWELLVRDDHSTDKTPQILKRFEEKDSRIHVTYGEENLGPLGNFQYLVGQAGNKHYVMFCDQDDIWKEEKIKVTYDTMRAQEKACGSQVGQLVFCAKELVDENGIPLENQMPASYDKISIWDVLKQNPVYGCTMMINQPLLLKAGSMPDYVQMHDYYYALHAALSGEITYINRALIQYRQHAGNVTGGMNNFGIAGKMKSFRKINRKLHETIHQNYMFCKCNEDGHSELKDYIEIIAGNGLSRLKKAKQKGYRLDGKLQNMRLQYALLTFHKR